MRKCDSEKMWKEENYEIRRWDDWKDKYAKRRREEAEAELMRR